MTETYTFALVLPPTPHRLSEVLVMNLADWHLNDAQAGLIFALCLLSGGDLNRLVDADTIAREFESVMAANPDVRHITHVATVVEHEAKETRQ